MEGIWTVNRSRVWLTIQQVYRAVDYFTEDPLRRAALRVALRACPWRRGWNYAFADVLKRDDGEFGNFIQRMAA